MIVPLRNLVYIIPLFDKSKIGSIHVPDPAKQRVDQGIVKYKGPDVVDIFVGDHVVFSGYSGDVVIVEGEGTLYVMEEEDIIAKIEDGNDTYLFTSEKVLELIGRAVGMLAQAEGMSRELVDKLEERLKSLVMDNFFEELHF